ncbi:hypothetical protein JHK87_022772 [Glycine soja]|nr:hypothetical protein JHK87_022772 [Glycine soja]
MGVFKESGSGFNSSIVKKGGEGDDGSLRSWRVFKFLSEHSDFLAEREKAKKKKREDLKASKERGKSDKRLKEEKEPKAEDTNKDESTSKEAYAYLLNVLAPKHCSPVTLDTKNGNERANLVLDHTERMGCKRYFTPRDVVEGTSNMNLAFIMRFTMLQLLKNLRSDSQGKEITDADILKWVNKKVKSIGRTSHIESSKVFSKRNSLFYLQLTIPNN